MAQFGLGAFTKTVYETARELGPAWDVPLYRDQRVRATRQKDNGGYKPRRRDLSPSGRRHWWLNTPEA
jgi:hypothetical protein